MHTADSIYRSLHTLSIDLERQMEVVKKDAEKYIATLPYPDDVKVDDVKDRNGRPVMLDLLVAKAQVLSGMAALKAGEMTQQAASRGGRR